MPGGPLEVGYGVSYLSIAIPVQAAQIHDPNPNRNADGPDAIAMQAAQI